MWYSHIAPKNSQKLSTLSPCQQFKVQALRNLQSTSQNLGRIIELEPLHCLKCAIVSWFLLHMVCCLIPGVLFRIIYLVLFWYCMWSNLLHGLYKFDFIENFNIQEVKRMEVNCLQYQPIQMAYHVAQRLSCLKYSSQDEDSVRQALQNLKESYIYGRLS